jgi:uncharacterized RDD family membrane protein YckC
VSVTGPSAVDGVLTGEAVLLESWPASFATRILGAIVDVVATWAIGLAVFFTLAWQVPESAAPALGIALLAVLLIGVTTAVETLSRGRSLGKLTTGTRVVRDDGGPERFRQAFARALVGVGEIWLTFGFVALVASLSNTKGKRVGDVLAGTYVVRVRGARALAPLPPVDPVLAAWARTADVARLPDGLALAARQFLGRANGLDAASRASLGRDLAGRAEPFVAPGPPWGTHPESFLAAVLAERRDREWAAAVRRLDGQLASSGTANRLPYGVPDPAR